ncbi:MAG: PKD domain-containing protein, partial [Ilumatobacter sp.]
MSKRVTAVGFAAALGATVLSIAAPSGPARAQAPQFVGVATAQADPVAQAAPLNPRFPVHPNAVSTEPVNWTPQILEGKVSEIDQVGDMIVVGGEFDQVAPPTGSPIQVQPNLFAFDATDGTISSTFTPSVAKEIRAVEPGPLPGTVYVGGGLDGINGQNGKLFLLNLSDGSIVPTFDDPPLNGAVNDLALVGDTLYVGGIFSTAAGQPYQGLLAVDAMTGDIDPTFNINLTENHSWTEGGNFARGGVGAREFDVDPSGSTLAVVGNFRKADGLDRRQMVVIDLTGPTAEVRPDWRTQEYEPTCGRVFDSYMRDIKFSPDGEYVTVVTTGGPRPPTLCDTVARFDMADTGDDVQPVWTNFTGGDTLLSTAISGGAVYTGGHQRWMNNLTGRDNADPGAIPRPGLSGHDAENGVPLSWNPGRNPRGVGAESLLVTEAGLWVGSDTDWIGNFQKFRPRIAFFPLAGAPARNPENAASLPANIYVTDPTAVPLIGNPLYRVNAGDVALPALDGGIPWSADNANANVLRNSGSNVGGPNPITTVTADVPPSAPVDLFSRERWDPGSANDGSEMEWEFPVAAGTVVDVRLYLGNGCNCTNDPGERVFDVTIDGVVVLDDYDIVADVGHRVGTMKEFRITSDGVIDIDFGHVVENPLVNGIEIIEPDDDAEPPAEPDLAFQRIGFNSGTVDPATVVDGPTSDMDWNEVVDAFMVDDELFYITTASEFFRRTFDGDTFGPSEIVDPYNDPFWSDKDSGKVVYRGTVPTFYGQIPTVAGLAYSDGRLFYTRSGNSELFVRWFVPESGVLNEVTRTVDGFDVENVGDIFFDESAGLLYFTSGLDGTLYSIAYADEAVTGTPVAVSGPGIDGMDWRATALFVGPDLPNQPPVASATADCIGLDCSFDGSASSDADGTVDAYLWDFGDGTTSTEAAPIHTYAAAGDYTVTLTVTDDGSFSDSVELLVSVEVPNIAPTAAGSLECTFLDCTFDGQASSDVDGTVDAYLWDFGDGTTSSEVAPAHTYAEGTYTVTLTVTDDDGDTGVWTADVTVQAANTAPVALIEASCDRLVCSFDGAASS